MKDLAIQIKDVSKQYRLGTVGTGTLTHDLNRWWHKIRGKEDPYLKIGEVNDRETKGVSEYVWALRDINFDVEKGEVLGIIGKNGAGKSTLLKILSQVTGPSQGTIKARGRIASLLEVGTGFHPELTGRENVFLNGTILGMSKKEVQSKLDEIVEFSGVERYIDTPVKRYSSGMKVRLAFAVAAHLDPEILVVDEVLAVGDAEFQKKAIGKMQDVSKGGGRTVLFVSHNMVSIKALCSRAILLENGTITFDGDTEEAIHQYIRTNANEDERKKGVSNALLSLKDLSSNDINKEGIFNIKHPVSFKVNVEAGKYDRHIHINFFFKAGNGEDLFVSASPKFELKSGNSKICKVTIPPDFFNDKFYSINLMVVEDKKGIMEWKDALFFQGVDDRREMGWLGEMPGLIRPGNLTWEVEDEG